MCCSSVTTTADRQLALLCLVTALGRCAFTGFYGNSLREMLYKRGKELKERTRASKNWRRSTSLRAS